jgi:hypothetical protein
VSDRERIRCVACGRWVVEVRRCDGGVYAVEWARPSRVAVRANPNAEIPSGTTPSPAAMRRGVPPGPVVDALGEVVVSLEWDSARSLAGADVRCVCGHWTTIA